MKKIKIALLFVSSWINSVLTSDFLRRYGVDSHIMKTGKFKKENHFNKPTAEIKNKKHKKKQKKCINYFSNNRS